MDHIFSVYINDSNLYNLLFKKFCIKVYSTRDIPPEFKTLNIIITINVAMVILTSCSFFLFYLHALPLVSNSVAGSLLQEEGQELNKWDGYVNWRNKPAMRDQHGGILAASFVLGQ